MQSPLNTILVAAFVVAPFIASAAPEPFDRYQVILERKPFGAPPPEPEAPPPPPVAEEPPWAKTYRLCSVYESSNADVQVALLDTRNNKPVMLTLGEEPVEGIALLSADVKESQATLSKDGLQVTMTLEAGKATAPRPNPATKTRATPAAAARATAAASSNRRPAVNSTRPRTPRSAIRAVGK